MRQKNQTKKDIFLILFSLRDSFQGNYLHPDYVNALNKIDVAFQGHENVIQAWHNLHQSFLQRDLINIDAVRDDLKRELLSQMAHTVGYKLSKLDMSKAYTPQAHGDKDKLEYEIRIYKHIYYKEALDAVRLQNKWFSYQLDAIENPIQQDGENET